MEDASTHLVRLTAPMVEDVVVNAALLVLYMALPAVAWWRTRSLAWVVIAVGGAGAAVGAAISGLIDLGVGFQRESLQIILLATLALVAVIAWLRPHRGSVSAGRQAISILAPVGVLLLLLALITVVWTDGLAFMKPVSFLIGHDTAEDNSRWLDYSAQWASGATISQPVPMGGPLQLYLTFVGTAMSVYSQVVLGGINEVAVAANSIVFGEYFLVVAMPLTFAVMAEAVFRSPALRDGRARGLIPAPLLWTGAGVLSVAALAVMAYGHLTLQFTSLVVGLWVATFLSPTRLPRARLLTSLIAAASMTVWLPLNIIAIVVVVTWAVVLVSRAVRFGRARLDVVGVALVVIVGLGVVSPIYSSMRYLIFDSAALAIPGRAGGGVAASGGVPALADSILFAARGGTEQAGPILILLAVIATIAASVVVVRQTPRRPALAYRSLAPLGMLAVVGLSIYILDFWGTVGGPHYGSLKFSFMVAVVALATGFPVAALLLDPQKVGGMSAPRWVAIAGVVLALAVDTLLPRAVGQARPQQWSPPIPFDNTSGSYWYPAEVNGRPDQRIADNPIACVYLPKGYPAPTAIVPSGLSPGQRVYACTRQLAGLGGLDSQAQPVVSWLLREWTTNTPAWSAVYDGLAGLPPEVLERQVILLDDGSNVKGVETLRSLLGRFPKDAAGLN